MKLSIGPILYFWPRETVLDFYRDAADSPAEIVCLGEAICAKRREIKPEDWFAIGRELRQAGKEVLLSTLTLVEAKSAQTIASGALSTTTRVRASLETAKPCRAVIAYAGSDRQKRADATIIPWADLPRVKWT